jgi:hypothetical protein
MQNRQDVCRHYSAFALIQGFDKIIAPTTDSGSAQKKAFTKFVGKEDIFDDKGFFRKGFLNKLAMCKTVQVCWSIKKF